MKVEYKVREVTRYIVTRWEEKDGAGSCEERGEYSNCETAYEVAYALCKAEHDQLGYPPGDMRIIYPHNNTQEVVS
jgi:hypothetical protein